MLLSSFETLVRPYEFRDRRDREGRRNVTSSFEELVLNESWRVFRFEVSSLSRILLEDIGAGRIGRGVRGFVSDASDLVSK